MKIIFIRIGVIIGCTLIFQLIGCGNTTTAISSNSPANSITSKVKTHKVEITFEELRNQALTITPEQLGLSLPTDKTVVYGILMDWGVDGGVATTVSFQTGDASLYLSSGGGVIGGGQHANVNSAAVLFVDAAQFYLDKATKAEATPLPAKDLVIFYFLTNKGIYTGQEEMKNFDNKSSSWLALFEEGNKVISELRLSSKQ